MGLEVVVGVGQGAVVDGVPGGVVPGVAVAVEEIGQGAAGHDFNGVGGELVGRLDKVVHFFFDGFEEAELGEAEVVAAIGALDFARGGLVDLETHVGVGGTEVEMGRGVGDGIVVDGNHVGELGDLYPRRFVGGGAGGIDGDLLRRIVGAGPVHADVGEDDVLLGLGEVDLQVVVGIGQGAAVVGGPGGVEPGVAVFVEQIGQGTAVHNLNGVD